jgi:hypothetical protein
LDGRGARNSSIDLPRAARLYRHDESTVRANHPSIRRERIVSAVIVRYRVKPGRSEENAELVRAVYAELAAELPRGFRYATFMHDDGVTFVHIAFMEDGQEAPLPQLPAFQRFQHDIAERCDEPPQVTRLTERVGSYGL